MSKSPEPDLTPPPGRRLSARDAIVVILLAVLLLVLFEGSSIRRSGEDMQPGTERDLVEAVGAPAGWVADRLPFDEVSDDALAVLGDDDDGDGDGGGGGGRAPSESPLREAVERRRQLADHTDTAATTTSRPPGGREPRHRAEHR